jgi:hypothetical protein
MATAAKGRGISIQPKPNSIPYTNTSNTEIQNAVQNSHRCQPLSFNTVNKLKAISPIITDNTKNSLIDIVYNQIEL